MRGGGKRSRLWEWSALVALVVGVWFGSSVLGGGLVLLDLAIPAPHVLRKLGVVLIGLLFLVDVWTAAVRRSFFPISLRRQAVKSLAYRVPSEDVVGFIWGVDVGTGVSTFRVTSGVWVLVIGAAADLIAPAAALVYGAGFGIALFAMGGWPVGRSAQSDDIFRRVADIQRYRRAGQVIYCVTLATFLVGAVR